MIDYEIHKLVLLSAGMSEQTLEAQRRLMVMDSNDYRRKLKRHLNAVPEYEFQRSPAIIKELFIKLIDDVAK